MTITARQATPADADAIWAFWESTVADDPSFLCSPGGTYFPTRPELDKHLTDPMTLFIIVEDGSIALTNILNRATSESLWTRSTTDHLAASFPVAAQYAADVIGINPWGFVGNRTLHDLICSFPGMVEDEKGYIHWVGH